MNNLTLTKGWKTYAAGVGIGLVAGLHAAGILTLDQAHAAQGLLAALGLISLRAAVGGVAEDVTNGTPQG